MSALTVKVIFFGLSMWVPNVQESLGMTVLMPDTTVQQYSSDHCRVPRHEPVLLVRGAKVKSKAGSFAERDLDADLLRSGRFDLGWNLRGLDLAWRGNGESKTPFSMVHRAPGATSSWPHDTKDAKAVDWVWAGSASFEERGIDSNCLTGGGEICPVAARVQVGEGEVATCRFAALDTSRHSNHAFREKEYCQGFQSCGQGQGATRMRRSHPLPTALRSVFSITALGEPILTLYATDFRDGQEATLELVAKESGKPIEIWIGNTPIGSHAPESAYCATHDRDRHFELFYLLAARDPGAVSPLIGVEREVPTATGRRMAKYRQMLQPEDACEVPSLFVNDYGHVPETSGVCGTGKGKPSSLAGPRPRKVGTP